MTRNALVCLAVLTPFVAVAQPAVVPIEGMLTNSAGTAVNGVQSLTFKLYSAAAGGVALYTETQPTVPVELGVFTAYLGDVTPLNLALFDGSTLWLGLTVGTDAEMTPRLRFGTVPYAANAGGSAIPPGAVMFFDLATCPPGWTELNEARGRTIVGLNPGGTLKAGWPTAGPGLANQSPNNITGPSAVPAHSHTLTNAAATIADHPAATFSTATDGLHGHTATDSVGSAHSHTVPANMSISGALSTVDWFTNSGGVATISTNTGGAHTHGVPSAGSSHSHSVTVPLQSHGSHTHANTVSSAGNTSVDVTMPYVQLLTCRKN